MPTFGEELIQSMREAVAYSKGEADPEGFRVHTIDVDVKKIRKHLNMTQKNFSADFGISLDTLRHWEQKRRTPEGPAKSYLMVIAEEPDVVKKALLKALQLTVK
jgi:putative transcriptional regulator